MLHWKKKEEIKLLQTLNVWGSCSLVTLCRNPSCVYLCSRLNQLRCPRDPPLFAFSPSASLSFSDTHKNPLQLEKTLSDVGSSCDWIPTQKRHAGEALVNELLCCSLMGKEERRGGCSTHFDPIHSPPLYSSSSLLSACSSDSVMSTSTVKSIPLGHICAPFQRERSPHGRTSLAYKLQS